MRKAIGTVATAAAIIVGSAGMASAADPHTVERGDTLSESFPDNWQYVCIVNVAAGVIPDCDTLEVGDQLRTEIGADERQAIDRWFANLPAPPVAVEPEPVIIVADEPAESVSVPEPEPEPAPEPEPEPVHEHEHEPQQAGGPSGGWAIPEHIVMCESGGDYTAENGGSRWAGSTASGAYQIIDGTWGGYGGYDHAADAPPSVQDERAAQIWNGGAGRGNWVC